LHVAQAPRRPGEAPLLGDRDEVRKLPKLHGSSILMPSMNNYLA
jgi:hypothetical protein